jgi:methanethiol S-methyltransferase
MAAIVVLVSMLTYGVIHSVLAGSRSKNSFRTNFGDRAYHGLYRIIYNAFAALALVPIFLVVALYPGSIMWSISQNWQLPLLIVQVIGLAGVIASFLQIDLLRFAGLRQMGAYLSGAALPLPEEPIQTSGVYGLVRHPLYFFSLLVIWPVQTMTEAYLGFCIGATIYFIVGSRFEERRLKQAFGPAYDEYRSRVAWMVPFLRFGNKP